MWCTNTCKGSPMVPFKTRKKPLPNRANWVAADTLTQLPFFASFPPCYIGGFHCIGIDLGNRPKPLKINKWQDFDYRN